MSRYYPMIVGIAVVTGLLLARQSQAEKFSGFYVGANLGYAQGEVDLADLDVWTDCPPDPVCPWRIDIDGMSGGIQAGHDWAFGSWRFGLVGEASFANIDGAGIYPAAGITSGGDVSIDRFLLLRARGGLIFGGAGDSFIYATLGGGWTHAEVAVSDTCCGMAGSNDDNVGAFAYGAGLEHQLTDTVSIGVEWLRIDAGTLQVTAIRPPSAPYRFKTEAEFDVFRLTANWAL